MKTLMTFMAFVSTCLTLSAAQAGELECRYISKKTNLFGIEKGIVDQLTVDAEKLGAASNGPVASVDLLDKSVLQIYASGTDKSSLSIYLRLKGGEVISATSSESAGNLQSSVHLNYKKSGLMTSVTCSFAKLAEQ